MGIINPHDVIFEFVYVVIYLAMTTISFYGVDGEYDFCSNDYRTVIVYDSYTFTSAEQVLMYMKAVHFNDLISANAIVKSTSAAAARELGQQITPYDEADWNKVQFDYLVKALTMKFEQNSAIRWPLTKTRPAILVESPPAGVNSTYEHNLLGRALMIVRDKFVG